MQGPRAGAGFVDATRAAAVDRTRPLNLFYFTPRILLLQVSDWLAKRYSSMNYLTDAAMTSLNDHLTPRTFLAGAGPAPSLADLVLAAHLGDAIAKFPAAQVGSHPAIARWYAHLVATAPRGTGGEGLLPPGRLEVGPLVLPVPAPPVPAAPAADKKKGGAAQGGPAAGAAPVATTAATAAGTAAGVAAGAAAPAAGAAPKKAKAKAGRDGVAAPAAAPAPPAAAAASPEDAAIAGLDFRVGKIVKAERHPDPEVTSLYVETIDLGEEGGPRTIVSGLAKYLPLEALADRLVVIVANLKPAKMKDVMSAGMVLCASAGEVCEPIHPPAGVQVGERVAFEGLTVGPPEPVHKKIGKLFDAAAPHLKVGEDGVCRFKGVPFGTSAGACTSGVVGGMIK